MAQPRTDEQRAAAKAARAVRQAAAEAEQHRAAEELRTSRTRQLESARLALGTLEETLRAGRKTTRRHEALSSHLNGFYDEIDKLAKGKTLLEVTDLVVEQANNIIRDAKSILDNDTYLDRTKEFVPAGDNPVYPDVLLSVRVVRESLGRFGTRLKKRDEHIEERLREARTIEAALEHYIEINEIPSKEDVEKVIDHDDVVDAWFRGSFGGEHFDLNRLDRVSLDEYLSADEDGDVE